MSQIIIDYYVINFGSAGRLYRECFICSVSLIDDTFYHYHFFWLRLNGWIKKGISKNTARILTSNSWYYYEHRSIGFTKIEKFDLLDRHTRDIFIFRVLGGKTDIRSTAIRCNG